ncbi:MAG: dihydroneopterin aldolase / 2-amino-4-hydroxy-6-hydroxymethyldihydropteridine diphosphokinase [Actinomycetota bacterium]|nr:dihydroneopterin aldolase / 2-amino-4-hydroxy-6-hydroxymethyldihydropteridine diphosphokinase [Actinomycetota bacterium]MDQ1541342.1 dihydroneopterin aldolase / 2-amino-4-hydroxy-6-hydroxymethyldihydropteridine diphosphokinase [Actinomycetota bacterium]
MRAALALGANIGDRAAALQAAVDALDSATRVVAVSAIFETTPVGGPPQPDFYNAVVVVDTELAAVELLALAHRIEDAAGRVRLERWGPRSLDVDVLAYGDARSDDPVLTLPHPRAHERGFVLLPWLDADPEARIEGLGAVADLAGTVDADGVRRLEQPSLRWRGEGR